MAALGLDIPHLSQYFSFPESTFGSLLDAPTADAVRSLLQSISSRAREDEEQKSENVRLTVELESAVRARDSKSRLLKTSLEKNSNEYAALRQKFQDEGEQLKCIVLF